MDNRFYALLLPDEEIGRHKYFGGWTVLFRYLKNRLQIVGFECDHADPEENKPLNIFNGLFEKIALEMKPVVERDVRLQTGYKGNINFMQDEEIKECL